jgi:hypothetical protein
VSFGGEERRPEQRDKEVELYIINQSEDVILVRGTYNLSKGNDIRDFCPPISFGNLYRTIVKSSSILPNGPIQCYSTYELVLRGQERMPIMGNHHAFLAIEASSEALSTKCTASAVIFTVKSSRFTGSIKNVGWLRNHLLRNRIIEGEKTFKFNINGRLLEIIVSLDLTRILVKLRSIRRKKWS